VKLDLGLCVLPSQLIEVFRPAILRLYAPKSRPIQLPTSPASDEPLNANSSLPPATHARPPGSSHTPAVDLGIARISLVVQAICFVIIAFSKDAGMFVAAGALGALATGYSPTTNSLSLELFTRRGGMPSDAGQLFGAMSVIQTVGYALPNVSCKVGCDVDCVVQEPGCRPVAVRHYIYQDCLYIPRDHFLRLCGYSVTLALLPLTRADTSLSRSHRCGCRRANGR
jgi:hypothetical protein